ncbi:MAG: type-F conjugative transfer system protein TraW [Pseudomonadota bacterium]
MKALIASAALGSLIGPVVLGFAPARALDHGTFGTTWPVIEPDLLRVIQGKLERAEANGSLADLNARFAARVKAKVMRPTPVSGIGPAVETRSWAFDPAIVLERDIRDHGGRLIAAAGQKVNPLERLALTRKLVFVNGDDPAELAWALEQGSDHSLKIMLVDGSPFEAMKVHQRRFYFDQSGKLTQRFGITHTPAMVEQHGDMLKITEQALPGRAAQ